MYTDRAKGRLKTGGAIFAETSAVIPAQAGIQKFEIAAVLKYSRNAKVWIPACAGMTDGKTQVGRTFMPDLRLRLVNYLLKSIQRLWLI